MVQLNFDAKAHIPLDNDPIPEGWYNFIIDDITGAPTKDGNPNHLRLNIRFSVMDGPYQGRKVFTGLNIRHTSVQAMEMANRELTSIAQACKLPYVQDSQQLHNIPLKGRVKIRKDPNGVYDDQAEIKSYKPIEFVPPGGFAQPGASVSAPAAAPPTGWGQPNGAAPAPAAAPQTGWGAPAPAAAPQAATPQATPQTPVNGGWQQPQTQQPWGQPPAAQPAATAPQQTATTPPMQPVEPQHQPAPQHVPPGFAAPQPAAQAQPAASPAPTPEVAAAQNAAPPWAR
jgi:hypothetical protein